MAKNIFMITIFIRTLIFYLTLTVLMRFMGKRQIGEMQLSEFVCVVLISEMTALPMTDTEIPLMYGIIPLLIIVSLEVIIAFGCMSNNFLRKIVHGKPVLLVKKGKLIHENLTKTRITPDEVESQIRINGYKGMWEVETVMLEQTGKMSVLSKGNPQNQS